jgi:membrane protein YqaA with SNARE-associated domain
VSDLAVYVGLFAVAFVAATVLPAQSEAALVALIVADQQPVHGLIAAASLGNTLGAVVNWALGLGVARFSGRRWFPLSPERLERASGWYRRWGRFSLLASWAPLVGDALTVAAGVLREPFWSFLALVALAKTGRYVVLAAATLSWI